MEFFLYILLAIVILLIMVVIHELGHYIAGKVLKFKINEFSVGFGPKIISKKRKSGEVFSLRLIPLGGYCAFEGETDTDTEIDKKNKKNIEQYADNTAQNDGNFAPKNIAVQNAESIASKNTLFNSEGAETVSRAFVDEKPWKRIIVFVAGGLFNLISAVIFSFICILIIGYAVPKVTQVYFVPQETLPYNQLIDGDEIVAVNGKNITIMNTFEDYTKGLKEGDAINVTIVRNGQQMEMQLKVQVIKIIDDNGIKSDYVGFGFKSDRIYDNGNFIDAVKYCVPFTGKLAWTIIGSFIDLLTGQVPLTSLSGPIGTIGLMAEYSANDWRNILLLLPIIASNLGLFNLLPIPALDGSKVVFTAIEWVRGKPVNRKVENMIHYIGLMALFAFVIIIDVVGMILR